VSGLTTLVYETVIEEDLAEGGEEEGSTEADEEVEAVRRL
jgi:hypothetical protein